MLPKFTPLAWNVTTNTTTAHVQVPASGNKTFFGRVSGTGAVTQTQAIYGSMDEVASGGVLLATLTLSGTTLAQDGVVMTANYRYYYVVTTNTTGTGAKGEVYAIY